MRKKHLILIPILVFTLFGFFAKAQIQSTDLVLNISPENPGPNQDVTATLSSHAINLDNANISWALNNQKVMVGIGKKSFSFKMGDIGSSNTLSVTVDTIDGQSILKTITITPADVDILWEASDSYTPPFYRGKALVPSQGTFKIVAIPNLLDQSGKVSANNLSYLWNKDGSIQTDSSGWGKSYFVFQNSYLDKGNTIDVKVSNISGSVNAENQITLQTGNPKIIFYENDPILGTKWEKALTDGYQIDTNGETLVAEPYFFSPEDISSPNLTFDWSLNGESITTPDPKNILSIKPEAGQSGNATIELNVNNVGTLFQSMTKQISVKF